MKGLFKPARLLVAALAVWLAGCATLPADQGRGEVASLLKERGRDISHAGDEQLARKLLAEIGDQPLSIHDAVRIALVGNPRLKAEYSRLGFASAEVYDAGRLSNPSLSASVLFTTQAGFGDERGLGLVQNFTSLLLLPARSRFAEGEFERVQRSVAAEIQVLAAEVEAAYYTLVGTQQVAALRATVATSARVSADLAQRFFDAGNISRLELSREQAAAAQARLDALHAQGQAAQVHIALARIMGVASNRTRWEVAARLPLPVAQEDALEALLKSADGSRLDLAAARKDVALRADALGVTRRWRYLGEVNVGVETTRIAEGARLTGPTLDLELSLFNQGKGRVARAQAELQHAEADLASLEIEIVSGVQAAHAGVANARERAEQYRAALIPQREDVVQRTQEQVNFMLKGQFELILAKQQEYDAYQGYFESVRDYWLARVQLARVVGAPLPSAAQVGTETLDVESLTTPKTEPQPEKSHEHHHGDHP